MGRRERRRVAILGGGPAGAAVATWLARGGVDVVLFARGKRPPIIVGESLVPAIVPYLKDLGVEREIAEYGVWKGGATFVLDHESRVEIRFDEVRGGRTTYSYNVPRDLFDASILEAARRNGVRVVEHMARVERVPGTDRVQLSEDALAAAGGMDQPDLIVDAAGGYRVLDGIAGIARWQVLGKSAEVSGAGGRGGLQNEVADITGAYLVQVCFLAIDLVHQAGDCDRVGCG